MGQQGFTVDVYQNEYLPEGGREVNAVVTVTSPDTVAAAPAAGGAEIIIVDCSGSMGSPRTKIAEARAATVAAVDLIRDGVAFAVIAGNEEAQEVFPGDGSLAIADWQTRELAKRAVAGLRSGGGTAIGKWLRLAHQLFASYPAGIRHAILLTDGKNQHETPEQLDGAISLCDGVFSCDCRGVGTDWEVGELRRISSAMLGTVDIVADPAGLAADFAAMMHTAMGKQVADVALRVWTPQHATVQFVKQVAPAVGDLTGGVPSQARRRAITRPAHGDQMRAAITTYASDVAPAGRAGNAGRPRQPGRRLAAAEVLGQGMVKAVWTDDEALSTRINRQVAHYTGQAELAQVIQEGLEARKEGDEETATAKLGRAVALAQQSGNEDTARLLAKVVDVVDAATGTVRLKKKVDTADEMTLDSRSTKTVRTKK